MSVFNKQKDRDYHGKPLPHFRVKYSTRERVKHIHHADRRGENAPGVNYSANPGWWDNLYTTRRRRADDRQNAKRVMQGVDPEGMCWMPDKRPLEYYW